jgi:hypothetical protein
MCVPINWCQATIRPAGERRRSTLVGPADAAVKREPDARGLGQYRDLHPETELETGAKASGRPRRGSEEGP